MKHYLVKTSHFFLGLKSENMRMAHINLKKCQLLNIIFEILHLIGKYAFVFSHCFVIFSRLRTQFFKFLDLKQKIYFKGCLFLKNEE